MWLRFWLHCNCLFKEPWLKFPCWSYLLLIIQYFVFLPKKEGLQMKLSAQALEECMKQTVTTTKLWLCFQGYRWVKRKIGFYSSRKVHSPVMTLSSVLTSTGMHSPSSLSPWIEFKQLSENYSALTLIVQPLSSYSMCVCIMTSNSEEEIC